MSRAETIVPGIRLLSPEPKPGTAWERPNLYAVGHDPVTLVDAGYDREDDVNFILGELGGARLTRIIVTHGHIDHAGGAWRLREATGARVVGHAADRDGVARRFAGRKFDAECGDGETFVAGDFTLETMLLPGHSPGHLALLIRDAGIVFSGDLVTGAGSTLVVPPEGDMRTYMESLRRLQAMPLQLLLPGHGPAVRDPAARIAELIAHRELREICLAKCLADAPGPLPLADLVRAMYLGLIHPQMMGAALGTALAHLQKLIADGLVTTHPSSESNPLKQSFALTPAARERTLALFARH